jgi:radical SAM superfamily enzyme YgiQ (UPF0313 family)
MTESAPDTYDFETGVYRPPSEGGSQSLLLRLTRNCPWNHCTFCGMYKEEKFQLRSVEAVKQDIGAMAAIRNSLRDKSYEMGYAGDIDQEVAYAMIRQKPELNHHHGFAMVFHWLLFGARTAFLQDADSLIMKTDQLLEILTHLRATFPSLERVTTYARSKTLAHKSMDDLKAIRIAGLDRVHVGLESGDNTVLKRVKKGVTGEIHIQAGLRAKEAGFQLSEYWMPGLGGRDLWEPHAVNTAKVLSAIDPDYIRSRPLSVWPGTPLQDELVSREFEPQSGREHLCELKTTIEHLDVTSRVCFDHSGNYWKTRTGRHLLSLDYEGYSFPEEKQALLALIEEGLKYDTPRPGNIRM